MPHVIVKLFPGRSEEVKKRLAEAIAQNVMALCEVADRAVSIAIEEVPRETWMETVYASEIAPKKGTLYKEPGY